MNRSSEEDQPVRAKSNASDTCSPTSNCRSYEVLLYNQYYRYSLFANFSPSLLPGVSKLKSELKAEIDEIGGTASLYSYYRILLACLPLILSIVPISFIHPVSGIATICWVIFTDVLASFPLSIKGIVLV